MKFGIGLGMSQGSGGLAPFSPLSLPSPLAVWPLDDGAGNTARNTVAGAAPVNLLASGESFFANTSIWVATGATVTDDAAASPDGDTSASRVVLAGGSQQFLNPKNLSLPAGTYTISVYHKRNTGSDQTWRMFRGDTNAFSSDITSTSSWQRSTWTITVGGGGLSTFSIVISDAGNDAADILIWGAQIELAGAATAYQRPALHAVMPSERKLAWTARGLQSASATYHAIAQKQTALTVSAFSVYAAVEQTAAGDANYNVIQTLEAFLSGYTFLASGDLAHINAGGAQLRARLSNPSDGAWHVVAATYSGSTVALYVDGVLVASVAGDSSTFSLRLLWLFGWHNFFGMPGEHGYHALYSAAHTDAQVKQMSDYVSGVVTARGATFATWSKAVVFEGDSITAGTTYAPISNNYPVLVYNALAAGTFGVSLAQSGSSISHMTTRLANVTSTFGARAWANKVLSVKIGTNDLAGADGATFITSLQTYVTAARAAGASKVIVDTVPHKNGDATFNGRADVANTAIRANAGSWHDGTPDTMQDALLADPSNATYFPDGVHWSATSHAIADDYFLTAINAVL